MLVAFVGNISVHSLGVVAALWAISGIGAGLAAASAYRSAASETAPKLLYALMMTGQMLFGLVAFLLVPMVDPRKRWIVYANLAALCLVTLVAARGLRDDGPNITAVGNASSLNLGLGVAAFTMSASLLLHFIANSMLWSFFDRVGIVSGIDPATVSKALALSMVGGLAGAAVSGIEFRGPSERLVIVSGILFIILSDLLLIVPSAMTYVCAGLLMNFSVMFVQPSYLSFLARLGNGAAAVTWGTLQTSIGLMVGPLVGGLLLGRFSVRTFVVWVALLFLCALALAILGFALRAKAASTVIGASRRVA